MHRVGRGRGRGAANFNFVKKSSSQELIKKNIPPDEDDYAHWLIPDNEKYQNHLSDKLFDEDIVNLDPEKKRLGDELKKVQEESSLLKKSMAQLDVDRSSKISELNSRIQKLEEDINQHVINFENYKEQQQERIDFEYYNKYTKNHAKYLIAKYKKEQYNPVAMEQRKIFSLSILKLSPNYSLGDVVDEKELFYNKVPQLFNKALDSLEDFSKDEENLSLLKFENKNTYVNKQYEKLKREYLSLVNMCDVSDVCNSYYQRESREKITKLSNLVKNSFDREDYNYLRLNMLPFLTVHGRKSNYDQFCMIKLDYSQNHLVDLLRQHDTFFDIYQLLDHNDILLMNKEEWKYVREKVLKIVTSNSYYYDKVFIVDDPRVLYSEQFLENNLLKYSFCINNFCSTSENTIVDRHNKENRYSRYNYFLRRNVCFFEMSIVGFLRHSGFLLDGREFYQCNKIINHVE